MKRPDVFPKCGHPCTPDNTLREIRGDGSRGGIGSCKKCKYARDVARIQRHRNFRAEVRPREPMPAYVPTADYRAALERAKQRRQQQWLEVRQQMAAIRAHNAELEASMGKGRWIAFCLYAGKVRHD